MDDEIESLFEIKKSTDAEKLSIEIAQGSCGFMIKLLSAPVFLTLVSTILAFLLPFYMGEFYQLLWLFGLISAVASLTCIVYGFLQWQFLTDIYKVIVILHTLLIISLVAVIAYFIWALIHASMKF